MKRFERGILIFEAVGEIDSRYVLPAEDALEQGKTVSFHSRRKLWRTLLIAAILSALFVGTAYATGFFGLSTRLVTPSYTAPAESRDYSYVIPNGIIGSGEAQAMAEWLDYEERFKAGQESAWEDYELSFTQGDYALKNICRVYGAYDKTLADKLLEISEKYSLKLYAGQLMADEQEQFYALSGTEDFFPDAFANEISYGYVFEDGSFKAEGWLQADGRRMNYVLNRSYKGALYPYSRRFYGEHEDWAYTTAQGYELGITRYVRAGSEERFELIYNDILQGVYINLGFGLDTTAADTVESIRQAVERLADAWDIEALISQTGTAGEILRRDRDPDHNRAALTALEGFENSNVFRANREFNDFFTATFYGECFTGVYGLEGYGDIDAELARLGGKFGLSYARHKTTGSGLYPTAAVYDNGAWFVSVEGTIPYRLHYIPKTALYTRLSVFKPYGEYDKVWSYETKSGETVACALAVTGDFNMNSVPTALYETEEAYVLLTVPNYDVLALERAADTVDFAAIKEG